MTLCFSFWEVLLASVQISNFIFYPVLICTSSSFIVTFIALFTFQAERELQPWIAKDDDLGQKMWRINQRIVKLIVELMRNHDTPESLVIIASASDLLLRATDGMLVDGEACTLPQLEVTSLDKEINFSHIIDMEKAFIVTNTLTRFLSEFFVNCAFFFQLGETELFKWSSYLNPWALVM